MATFFVRAARRLGGLSQAEQRELEQRMQKRQVKEFVGVSSLPPSTLFLQSSPSSSYTTIADTAPPPPPPQQLFGNLVDHCFSSCVNDFTSKAVSERESGCVSRCVQKYMAGAQRLSERFQEHNADMATKMGQR